jgi:2,3-bisphosphoglycerate-dependent phosphoglycerate mutase
MRLVLPLHSELSAQPFCCFFVSAAIPLVYEFDADLKPLRHYYLADDATVKAKIEAVAKQGSAASSAAK